MREILQNALTSWDKYWDGSIYPYLLLGAALYLLFFEKKRKQAGYLLGYLVITLALMFCPVTAALIEKCIGGMVYWRVVWIFPALPVIALGFTSPRTPMIVEAEDSDMKAMVLPVAIREA